MTIEERISEFEKTHAAVIAYGGDGTVLDAVKKHGMRKAVIPVRNYCLCQKHKDFLDKLLDDTLETKLKLSLCPFLKWMSKDHMLSGQGIAEVTLKSADSTCAVRFNLYVDSSLYMKNVIADGIVLSTAYGSTGYFKSVARCIFSSDSIGAAFIAPSQGINNVIVDSKSKLTVEILRDADIIMTADKDIEHFYARKGEIIAVERIPEQASLLGLDEFHCQECRALRHSTIEDGIAVQDKYAKI